jgi:uncharacterized protein with von Willebrand factor type A (vWA) domain
MPGHLAENVVRFAHVLRAAGIPVGSERVIEAVRVLPAVGLDARADWHHALASLFLTRRDQQPIFDEAFAIFFRDPALEDRMRALLLPKVHGRAPRDREPAPRVADALRGPRPAAVPRETREESLADAVLTFSDAEQLRRLDFEKMTIGEWHAARRWIARIELPVPSVRSRRKEAAPAGRIDLAATLRRMAREGGELHRPARRRAKQVAAPIVALCDVSGSMHRYTRPFLHFLHALTRERPHVSTLLFGTRLTNVTRHMRHRDPDEAVAAISAAVQDWSGGTRIASCLREFNHRWSRRLLAQNACVLLVSDGLEREEGGALGAEMARLARASHRLVWLNPLLRYEGFRPVASGIAAMRPHVDAFLPVHNVESLEGLAQALGARAGH